MTRKTIRRATMLAGLLFLALGAAFFSVQVATVSLPKEDNRLLAAIRVTKGDPIRLTYRHSVELTRVEGIFKIGPDSEILAVMTRMESTGTGLPNTHPERTRFIDGWIEVDEGEKPAGPIRFYFVRVNKTRLEIAGKKIDLSGLRSGALVQIAARKVRLLSWLLF